MTNHSDGKQASLVKPILMGLGVSVILVPTVSFLTAFVFYMLGRDTEYQILGDNFFLLTDLVVCGLLFFWSGRLVSYYAGEKKVQCGLIVISVTLLIFLILYFRFDTFQSYPIWHSVLSLLAIPVAVGLGVMRFTRRR